MPENNKPLVLITGASGNIGSTLAATLEHRYHVVGCDRKAPKDDPDRIKLDLGDDEAVRKGLAELRRLHGNRIAAVIHLAAYFDFSGEDSPLYDTVNVEGTRRLIQGLQDFEVERFIYSSTMLVSKAGKPGEHIDEDTPAAPRWAYPESKSRSEDMIRQHHGKIPYLILRLAGLYDDRTAVPTLAHQIARIYERNMKSHLFAGDEAAGQSFIHKEDMMAVFKKAVEKRNELPPECVILAGEEEAVGYGELQDVIGRLIHGDQAWETLRVPAPIARTGAWLQEKSEPVVPDDFDHGEKPFIRPFMIELASDHYALNISKARRLLDWTPRHSILDSLPRMIDFLKKDAAGWYEANGIRPPDWMAAAQEKDFDPEQLRRRFEEDFRAQHRANLWAPFMNMGLGLWLLTSPAILGYESTGMVLSDLVSGALVMVLAFLSLSWRLAALRWALAAVGCWLLLAPLAFYVPNAAAYLNGTLVGALVIAFSVCVRPPPGVTPPAALTGPTIPAGWDLNPSSWFQRLPIIILAFVGFFISRHLAAYQLGHIEGVWDPFFGGAIPGDGKNGSEEIVTSSVSEAWPVPDAGLGALTYMLEILTGLIGSTRRWRTMPWLVLVFGIMIVPLGAVSITFIIIQPVLLNTWCALCLVAAAAMLIQIPYSFDELVATGVFLWRRRKKGRPLLRILFTGDTEEGRRGSGEEDDFEQSPGGVIREMLSGGITLPWTLLVCIAIGLWLMFTRLTLGAEGGMANADHVIGSLIITVSVTALAEVARAIRYLNIPLAAGLLFTPFLYDAGPLQAGIGIALGVAVIVLSLPRGSVKCRYGEWDRFIR